MSFDATPPGTPPRTPIGTLRISSIAMSGVLLAVGVPAAAATIAMATQVSDQQAEVRIDAAGPITRIVVADSESDVQITGDTAATGVSGQALVQWKGRNGRRAELRQSLADGVLTLAKDCSSGGCGPVDITLTVPAGVSVKTTTSDGDIALSGVTGAVDLATSRGSISADRLGSGDASFTTADGAIEASFTGAPARIAARTTDDSVTIATDGRTPYYDSIDAAGGGRTLSNVQDLHATDEIDVTTTNGDVTIS